MEAQARQIPKATRVLPKEFAHMGAVLTESSIAQIREASREALDELPAPYNLHQQVPGIGGHDPAIERSTLRLAVESLNTHLVRATVCPHPSTSPFLGEESAVELFCRNGRPFFTMRVRNQGENVTIQGSERAEKNYRTNVGEFRKN
jgi:hypothetical protein